MPKIKKNKTVKNIKSSGGKTHKSTNKKKSKSQDKSQEGGMITVSFPCVLL